MVKIEQREYRRMLYLDYIFRVAGFLKIQKGSDVPI